MDSRLKQRLIGAAVLVALAVLFLPMLVKGPAPESGVADLPLQVPAAPRSDYVVRDLPLVAPAAAPEGGALGIETGSGASRPAPGADQQALPPVSPDGGYIVHFGSYSSSDSADTVVEHLSGAGFPASKVEATVSGRQLWRVQIGRYASQAQAESVRLRAAQIGTNDARVVALDVPRPAATPSQPAAEDATPGPAPSASAAATPAPAPAPTPAPAPAPAPAPVTPPAAAPDVGFVVQLGAFQSADVANALRDRVRGAGFNVFTDTVQTDNGRLTRVKVGPVVTRSEAEQLAASLQSRVGESGQIRSHP